LLQFAFCYTAVVLHCSIRVVYERNAKTETADSRMEAFTSGGIMSRWVASRCGLALVVIPVLSFLFSYSALAQKATKPLRASEVMALQAGGALQANIAHDIAVRGINFPPDSDFLALMTKAGADASLIATLKTAKVTEGSAQPDKQLLQQLCDAAVMMQNRQYGDAADKLSNALDTSFARVETGYVMAELLRQQEKLDVALSVYREILDKEPDFPEVHVKASYLLYRMQDVEGALNEAKAALADNPNDAEAHKNAGLALEQAQKFEAAIGEYKEALRIKPDYAAVHYDLGLLYYHTHNYNEAIADYKKCIAIDPKFAIAHNNLGMVYMETGDPARAVPEFREAKRLNPQDPMFRQNLASALMKQSPAAAVVELRELEAKFPNFEVCHVCLGNTLAWQGDTKGAEQEYQNAAKLDPADAAPVVGLGSLLEKEKNYDGALEQYRKAEQIASADPSGFKSAGRVLMAKNDFAGAIAELKQAESVAQSDWEVHELYGQALQRSGQLELSVGELKEAVALNPTRALLMTELGGALEKKGDWVGALEQYRKAVLTDAGVMAHAVPGRGYEICGEECNKQFTAAKARFSDYVTSLRAAGKSAEAAELEKKVAALDTNAGSKEKIELAMKAGDRAFQERKIDEAAKQYKEAVQLSESLPPGDDTRIAALGRLGNAYGMQQNFADASAMFHQQLELVEKAYGPESEKSVQPLQFLGQLAAWQKNYKEADSYLERALAITTKANGDNDPRAVDSLRNIAGLYMAQSDWPKAETYLLRAVKGAQAAAPDMELIPLWGLCDLYDKAGNPEKSQGCWHQATDLMAQRMGQNNPQLAQSMTNEATALRKLGRNDEAQKLEQRVAGLQSVATH
jgi:tetratricopeptide (TPR) repeat protein